MAVTYYRRPEILAEPGFQLGHVVIEASAGTGKTFTLEHLVLDLIINNRANIEQILVVTFTDAATRELRERVRALIRKVCDNEITAKPDKGIEHHWEVNDVVRARLQEALFRFDGAAISTIHGFCQRILSEQAFLGGRLFEQVHIDGREAFGAAFREEGRLILQEDSPLGEALRIWIEEENALRKLQDLLYVCHREGCPDRCPLTPKWDPAGFTRALQDLPLPDDLLGVMGTFFTNRHQRSGYERLVKGLSDTLNLPVHSSDTVSQETVKHFLDWAKKSCRINNYSSKPIDHLHRAAGRPGAPDILKTLAEKLEEMMHRAASNNSRFVYELLPRIQKRLGARKLSLGLIDYDDMLLGVREALAGGNAALLLDILRQRWKYALVDEFQDTDPVQWEIFRRIFVDGNSGHHLFVIGDPKQAIYGFRGADVHTYEEAKKHLLEKCRATRLSLKNNYRSTAELIDAVNTFFTAGDQDGKGFFNGLNRYDEPVQWGRESASAGEGGKPAVPVHLIHLYGEEAELKAGSLRRGLAHFIAGEINRLTDKTTGLTVGKDGGRPLKLSDIYILTRSSEEGQKIGQVLRGHGIHHAFYKLEGLFKTNEAEDMYRLFAAVEAPPDPAKRMAAWLTPFFGVPLERLEDWREIGEHHPLMARLLRWKGLSRAGEWARLFDDILTNSGLVRRLIFCEGERELTNYFHLFELLLAEAHARPVTLADLARSLRAQIDGRRAPTGREGDMQRLETDKEAVQILTMHKAKGLEAEVIFVAGGFGNPPFDDLTTRIYHRDNRRHLHIGRAYGKIGAAVEEENCQENQRLAYVALTRARSRIYLPYLGSAPAGDSGERRYGYSRLGKFYKPLQEQLDLLRSRGLLDGRLFALRQISCNLRPGPKLEEKARPEDRPGENFLKPLPSTAERAKQIEPVCRGVILTSYTRMKQGKAWQPPVQEEDGVADWRSEEVDAEIADGPFSPFLLISPGHDLPGGRETGIFLHALLEGIPSTDPAGWSFEQWSRSPAVQAGAAACARRHGFPEKYLPDALEMVYRAYMTPLRALSQEKSSILEMREGIISGKHLQAEISFVYPIPEDFHPLLKERRTVVSIPGDYHELPFRARRGYILGLIDLVFEHEGKIYLLDWKSDSLPSFDEDSINTHVKTNYNLQLLVYQLAVLRLLGIASAEKYESLFGGILYLFIRGIGPGGAVPSYSRGVWFSRPCWSQVVEGEQNLLRRQEWGGEVITGSNVGKGGRDDERRP